MKPSHVLVPLDGSPLAREALGYALVVHDCRVTVLNVVTSVEAGMSEATVLTDDERKEDAADRAERIVNEVKAEYGEDDRQAETVVVEGEPGEAILGYLEDSDVDQVVMGSHGGDAGRLTRRLLGTVSTKVVGKASVSVTVVR